jgi:K+-sensing histidine kinase KdpD
MFKERIAMTKKVICSRKYKWMLLATSVSLLLIGPVIVALLKYDFQNHNESFISVLFSVYRQFFWEFDFESLLTMAVFLALGAFIGYLIYRFRKVEANFKPSLSLEEMIKRGESDLIEFKASFRWDLRQNKITKEIELSVLKTVAAFLNSSGGTLLIGVNDDGSISGLENDYKTFKRKDRDGFAQFLMQMISVSFGADTSSFINLSFVSINEDDVAVVKVTKSNNPIFFKRDDFTAFYIRAGNTTRELDVEEALRYITAKAKIK